MATKDVNLNINVNGEDQIRDVNEAIVQTNVSAEKMADNALKLTKGIAGGFELAAQAAGLFGEETANAFQDTVKRATQYIALSNALKDVAEGFSVVNVKGLKDIVGGFNGAIKGVKVFGISLKSALIASGIGIFLIALGTVVAYWEEISGWINNANKEQEDYFVTQQKIIDRNKILRDDIIEGLNNEIKLLEIKGKKEDEIFNKKQAALVIEKNQKQDQLDLLAKEIISLGTTIALNEDIKNGKKQISDLTQDQFNALAKYNENEKASNDLLAEKQKQYNQIGSEINDLNNKFEQLTASENKFIQETRKAEFMKKNAAIQAEMERNEAVEELFKKDAEKRFKEFEESSKKIVQSWEDAVNQIAEINAEFDEEKLDPSDISPERTAAILDIQEKLRVNAAQKLNSKLLEEEISFLKEKTDRTLEEDELLMELRAEKRVEELELISEYVALAGDSIDQVFSILAERQQQQFEGLQLQFQLVDAQYTESVNNRRALEEELATAEGARREQILNSLQEESSQEKKLAKEKEKIAKAQIDIQNKINLQEYANAIIQSTILTAQAVLKALAAAPPPANAVLAAITAGLAAVQTGIVIANKPKPIGYAEGGFTSGLGFTDGSGHQVAGVVHANEYVVPQKVLNSDSGYSMVQALEAMRQGKQGFADGGFTTPQVSSDVGNSSEALIAALKGLNLAVAVTEIRDVNSRVEAIETRAGI